VVAKVQKLNFFIENYGMKIGFDAKRYFFNHTGLGNYCRQFVDSFAKNNLNQILFLFSPKKPTTDFIFGDKIKLSMPTGFWKIFGGVLWRSFGIYFSLKKEKINLFVGLSNELPFFMPKSVRKIVVIHDLIFIRFPKMYPPLDRFFYRIKTKNACRNADQIIAVSEQTKQDLVDFYKILPSKIVIIPPIIDSIFYAENQKNEPIFIKKPYILSVGAITARKNLLQTVRAFHKISTKTDVNLVVVGTATGIGNIYLSKIKSFISENNLETRVVFLEKIPNNILPNIYKHAEYLVYPSQFEGFGMPIAEALFLKTAVITSKEGCFRATAGNGAVYIDPENIDELAETMENLLNNDVLRADLGKKGCTHVQQFRADAVGKLIENILNPAKTTV
jgi:glycosyltransferase involved in cell wall biosynthesis